MTFDFPRQDYGDFLCLRDYVEPARDGKAVDYVAFMAVTMGREVTQGRARVVRRRASTRITCYLHGLGVESAEALAEMFHQQLRARVGHRRRRLAGRSRSCSRGTTAAAGTRFGYPACPNLEDQAPLFTLIDPTRVGITLSEQFQLEPEQSTTAIVVHHPDGEVLQRGPVHGLCGKGSVATQTRKTAAEKAAARCRIDSRFTSAVRRQRFRFASRPRPHR